MGSISNQISQIDFTDLNALNSGGERWELTRMSVEFALKSQGCFDAVYPGISEEIRRALFDLASPELFELPLETKLRTVSDKPFQGYIGQIPGFAYESLRIGASVDAVEDFARIMWPQGNPDFCNAVVSFIRPMEELQKIIHKMIFEIFGVEKHYDAHMSSVSFGLRLSEYGFSSDQNNNIVLPSHFDPNLLTLVCHYKIQGLQIETLEGNWIDVLPFPNSVTVLIGQSFQAWSNGKLRATNHRVKLVEEKKRFTAIFASRPSYTAMVEAPEELVDEENPLLYKPYNYDEYIKFRVSEEGLKNKDPFAAYCGISREVST